MDVCFQKYPPDRIIEIYRYPISFINFINPMLYRIVRIILYNIQFIQIYPGFQCTFLTARYH